MRRAFCAAVDKCRKEVGGKENVGYEVTGKPSWFGPAVAERGQWGGLGTHLLSSLRSSAGGEGREKAYGAGQRKTQTGRLRPAPHGPHPLI